MAYFSKDFIQFFKELGANNSKEWFDANKKRYERDVKQPFQSFIGEVINRMKKVEKDMTIEPKDAIFRINRDIRFSKDKTPYKVQMSAALSKGGRKDFSSPGMYLEFSPEHVRVYGGVYMPEKDELHNIRSYISRNGKELRAILSEKEFKKMYGSIRGEQNKIIPKEFKGAAEKEPLILNKQFYYFAEMKPEIILKNDLPEIIMNCYAVAGPMRKYLTKALKD